jgi:putative DNA primase/helicase
MCSDIEKVKDKKYFTHLKNSAASQKLTAMLTCAKAYLGVNSDEFDADQYMLNCENCIIDLRTGKQLSHSPNALMTKIAHVNYDPDAQCPVWLKFLDDIFLNKQDLIDFMQQAIGYSLSGDVREQCLFILYGVGRNGKSRFLSCISDMLGDYSSSCPASTFIKKNNNGQGIPNDIARLKGSRMVTAIESNQNVSLDESTIKHITGGTDKVTARFLNREFFEFLPTFKIFFTTNHKPNIRGTDPGIWRRIKMVPFDFKVTDETDDKYLGEKLRAELSGILNWALDGNKSVRERGLITPKDIQRATAVYRAEEDAIGQFIKDECIVDTAGWISVAEFKDRMFIALGFKLSQKQIGAYMEANGYKNDDNRKNVDGKTVRVYNGIRWSAAGETQTDIGWEE